MRGQLAPCPAWGPLFAFVLERGGMMMPWPQRTMFQHKQQLRGEARLRGRGVAEAPPGKHCSPELNVRPPGCRVAACPPSQQGQHGQSSGLHPPLPPGAAPARVAGLHGAQASRRASGGSPVLPSPASWRPPGASEARPAHHHKAASLAPSQAEATWVCLLSLTFCLRH